MKEFTCSDGVLVSVRRKVSAYASAVAKHVSSEGCQFIVERENLVEGQRFTFTLDDHAPIQGTVRWVMSGRVGFAFDTPILREAQRAMESRGRVMQGLELYLT